jgi:hypothetical protein
MANAEQMTNMRGDWWFKHANGIEDILERLPGRTFSPEQCEIICYVVKTGTHPSFKACKDNE